MIIRCEPIWNGSKLGYRMTDPKGHCETVYASNDEYWTPKLATRALDTWVTLYGYKRKNLRFEHF